MSKDKALEKIVKNMTVYILRRWDRDVKKTREGEMKEWFSGFWLADDALLLEECSRCADILANYAMKEYPNGIVKVGNIRLDKTFHDDYKQIYYNFGIEFGGTNDLLV